MDSTDNYLQLGDKNNVVGYDASETENYADMRGYDTIIGGSEKDLIINYSGADSLMGGVGSDFIFTPDSDRQKYDGTDTVNGGNGNDLLWIDNDVVAKLDGLFVGSDDRITLTHLDSLGQRSLDHVT